MAAQGVDSPEPHLRLVGCHYSTATQGGALHVCHLPPGMLLIHPLTHSLTHSLAHSLTRSLARSLARSLTHPPNGANINSCLTHEDSLMESSEAFVYYDCTSVTCNTYAVKGSVGADVPGCSCNPGFL